MGMDSPEMLISTVAGVGIRDYNGDGGPAVLAWLHSPRDVAVDGSGNLYIADTWNNRIRRIDTAGNISTMAGTGEGETGGDGGPADQAQLYCPQCVAVDSAGNIYIADTFNRRIRKVDPEGVITTVAGTGEKGDGGPAVQESLDRPEGVTVDGSGNLYIADTWNHRIRKVDATGKIFTVAGAGASGYSGDGGSADRAQLYCPGDVAVDGSGNLYIADRGNDRIRKVDAAGKISTVAGTGEDDYGGDGGPAVLAQLRYPNSVATDGSGNLYIADTWNNRIRKIDITGNISTVAGNGERGAGGDGGPAVQAQLRCPNSVAVDSSSNLYIADRDNDCIRKVDAAGNISTIAGFGKWGYGGDGGPAVQAHLYYPRDVAVDKASNLYIADRGNDRIRKVDAAGNISTVAGTGEDDYGGDGGPAVLAQLDEPTGVAVDGTGNIYIADLENDRIRKVDATGNFSTVAGTGEDGYAGEDDYGGDGGPAVQAQLYCPCSIAVDGSGNFYIADSDNHRIRKVDAVGNISTVAGTGREGYSWDGLPAIQGYLNHPEGVTVDDSGNLYIADTDNHRICKVNAEGKIFTVAGTGAPGYSGDGAPAIRARLYYPGDVAADKAGNLYIADTNNHRIRKVDAAGNISTVAGTGESGYSGDGGSADRAQLHCPCSLAVDGSGKLYIADTNNHRIRRLRRPGT